MTETLVNDLCRRRLCLSSNFDIEKLRAGYIKNQSCECGSSYHIACAFEKKGSCFICPKLWNEYV